MTDERQAMFDGLRAQGLSEAEAAATAAWPSHDDLVKERERIDAAKGECPDSCGYACGPDSECWAEQNRDRR